MRTMDNYNKVKGDAPLSTIDANTISTIVDIVAIYIESIAFTIIHNSASIVNTFLLLRDFSSFDIILLHQYNPDGTFVFLTDSILNNLTSL